MRRATTISSLVAFVVLAFGPAASAAERPPSESNVIEGRYIVVFDDSAGKVSAEVDKRERRLGFQSDFRYRRALKGFAARLSPGQLKTLRDDPEVDFVSEDRRVEAAGNVPLAPGEPTPPTGVRRVLSATTTTAREASGTNVAVLDTGVQLTHPDLNAADGTDCISPGTPADDDNGHGTHVAGSIAAKNNGSGVVGVAPNTNVYAVKVLDSEGDGFTSTIVCGIDWVTANRSALDIRVANMSLGGLGDPVESCSSTEDAMHAAICSSTAAGVNYVVAAGNSGWDFDFAPNPDVPAAYPEVLTVTALSDSDGAAGGSGGAPTCRSGESDDAEATFSNFAATSGGADHTIAAPGVCINSTWPGSTYSTISGTSMASPHMAGVVALCIDEAGTSGPCASKTPAQVIQHVRSDAQSYNTANPGYGFLHDPIHSPIAGEYYGFLTRTPPPVAADTTKPTARPPVQQFVANQQLGTNTSGASVPTRLAWAAGSDNVTSPANLKYRLAQSVNGGAFSFVTNWTSARAVQRSLTPGSRYRYRVYTKDEAGNVSLPATGPSFNVLVRQENASVITYSAGWLARASQSTAYGGFLRPTATAGAKAQMSFSGRNVAVVMPKKSTLGTARVCLFQGTTQIVCSNIDLSPATGLGPRKAVFVRNGLNPSSTYRVQVSDVSGRIELDAIVALR